MMAAKALTAKAGFSGVTEDAKDEMWLDALKELLNLL
jgi:hypothetical protein